MATAENALNWAIQIANDQSHGYSQQNRFGPDYDCSSLVISAYKNAGVPIDWNKVCYTGNMQNLLQYGFKDVTSSVNLSNGSGLQKGDILWWHGSGNNGHTALFAGNGQIVHARGQSYGSPKTGDQGTEIAVTPYYSGKWQHVYRYGSSGSATPVVNPSDKTTSSGGSSVTRYAVNTKMPIIKKGSKGKCVKIWQVIIGASVDGEFGPKTKTKTIEYQKKHGLEADGEVGPATWSKGLGSIK